MTHTPGPLKVADRLPFSRDFSVAIISSLKIEGGHYIAEAYHSATLDGCADPEMEGYIDDDEVQANAARLVACWNACEGINPEAVRGLLEASRELLQSLNDNGTRDEFTNTAVAASKVEVAIAKAKHNQERGVPDRA